MKILNHAYIFEEKIYIQPYFFVLLLQSMQLALIAVLQKSYVSAKCKLQQLQTAKGVVYCSFSYSPRFTFLIILFVARLTKEYITDLSDNRSATNLWKNIAGDTRDALTESFFASLKKEYTNYIKSPTVGHLRDGVAEYVELWYNYELLHSTLEYQTPGEVRELFQKAVAA